MRWIDCVKEDMEMAGVKEENAGKRSTWRTAIRTGDPTQSGNKARRRERERDYYRLSELNVKTFRQLVLVNFQNIMAYFIYIIF